MAPRLRDEEEGLLLSPANSKGDEAYGRRSMSSTTTPHFATTTVAVEGMTCGACTSALEGEFAQRRRVMGGIMGGLIFPGAYSWIQGRGWSRIVLCFITGGARGGDA